MLAFLKKTVVPNRLLAKFAFLLGSAITIIDLAAFLWTISNPSGDLLIRLLVILIIVALPAVGIVGVLIAIRALIGPPDRDTKLIANGAVVMNLIPSVVLTIGLVCMS